MLRSLLFILILLCLGWSNHAQAEIRFGHVRRVYYRTAPSAPARHDDRIDHRLLQAAHIADQRAARKSTFRCWRYVKIALLEAGAVTSYPSTNYAKQAGNELTNRYGFVRLPVHDPYRAPVGSVIVYGGSGAGHVELRTERGFASDYRRSAGRCRFPLIGIYAKMAA